MSRETDAWKFSFAENGGLYTLVRARQSPSVADTIAVGLDLDWNGDYWRAVPAIAIDRFLPESSDHRPVTLLKMQYDEKGIYGLFQAEDRYVRCVHTNFQDPVCKDSCVEVYFQPNPDSVPVGSPHASYLNLEISGNGTLLSYHIRDAERAADGFKDFDKLSAEDGAKIVIESTLPSVVYPEIEEELEWRLAFFLPFEVLEKTIGIIGDPVSGMVGQRWGMNAFKCTEDSSHPHWASWQPCSAFNFHEPSEFGFLLFE